MEANLMTGNNLKEALEYCVLVSNTVYNRWHNDAPHISASSDEVRALFLTMIRRKNFVSPRGFKKLAKLVIGVRTDHNTKCISAIHLGDYNHHSEHLDYSIRQVLSTLELLDYDAIAVKYKENISLFNPGFKKPYVLDDIDKITFKEIENITF